MAMVPMAGKVVPAASDFAEGANRGQQKSACTDSLPALGCSCLEWPYVEGTRAKGSERLAGPTFGISPCHGRRLRLCRRHKADESRVRWGLEADPRLPSLHRNWGFQRRWRTRLCRG